MVGDFELNFGVAILSFVEEDDLINSNSQSKMLFHKISFDLDLAG